MTLRPLNAFRGFKPAPGQEPEVNVQLDVAGFAFAEPDKEVRAAMNNLAARAARRPLVAAAARRARRGRSAGRPTGAARWTSARRPRSRSRRKPVVASLLPEYAIAGGARRAHARRSSARCSIRRAGRRRSRGARPAPTRLQRGQFALTGTMIVDGKSTAFLREVAGGKSRRVQAGRDRSTACWWPK